MPFEDLVYFDGSTFPPFPPLAEDAEKRFKEIKHLETRKDDVLLFAYPKAVAVRPSTMSIKPIHYSKIKTAPSVHMSGIICYLSITATNGILVEIPCAGASINRATGTHWLWEILHMLLRKTSEYTPLTKEYAFIEAIPNLSDLDEMKSPRVLNTHIPFRWLPEVHLQDGRRIVHIVRNPKDVAVSLYNHWHSSNELGVGALSWSEFFEEAIVGPKNNAFDGWCKFEKTVHDAKENRTDLSIYTMYYEKLKKHPEEEIKKLSVYLGVEVTDELCTEIAEKCSFKKLKEADTTIKDHGELGQLMEGMGRQRPNFYRKGEIGDWKNWFTPSQNERYNALIEDQLKGVDIELMYE